MQRQLAESYPSSSTITLISKPHLLPIGALLRVAMLATVVVLGTACASWRSGFDTPTIELAGLEPMAISKSGAPQFLIKLRVVNPNTIKLAIKGLHYAISVEGYEVFTGASSKPTTIPAYGEGTVSLTAVPSLLGGIGLLKSMAVKSTDNGKLNYELSTKISLGGIPTPLRINHKGEFDVGAYAADIGSKIPFPLTPDAL